MSRMGIGTWFNFKKMSPPKAVTLVFVASILLIVVSYGIWQFGQIISPSQQFSSDPFIELSISDYDDELNPLPNNLIDQTPPKFTGTNATELVFDSSDFLIMARMEGELDYR